MILGAYIGGKIAVPMSTQLLKDYSADSDVFGSAAVDEGAALATCRGVGGSKRGRPSMSRQMLVDAGVLLAGLASGIASGMFGIGGGVILVPILGLLLGFSQHRAQGTSLVALIPPTGLLAVIAYAKSDYVSWQTGLLLIPECSSRNCRWESCKTDPCCANETDFCFLDVFAGNLAGF